MTLKNGISFGLFITNSDRPRLLSRLSPAKWTGLRCSNLNNRAEDGHKTKVKVNIKIAIRVSSIRTPGGLIPHIQPSQTCQRHWEEISPPGVPPGPGEDPGVGMQEVREPADAGNSRLSEM